MRGPHVYFFALVRRVVFLAAGFFRVLFFAVDFRAVQQGNIPVGKGAQRVRIVRMIDDAVEVEKGRFER